MTPESTSQTVRYTGCDSSLHPDCNDAGVFATLLQHPTLCWHWVFFHSGERFCDFICAFEMLGELGPVNTRQVACSGWKIQPCNSAKPNTRRLRTAWPVQRGNVRLSNLQVLNAILYVVEHGCKWRGLPSHLSNWHTIYTRMSRWSKSGVLDRVFAQLQRSQIARITIDAVSLDSTSVKVHPDATGALKKAVLRPSANPGVGEIPRFIWLPRMSERP